MGSDANTKARLEIAEDRADNAFYYLCKVRDLLKQGKAAEARALLARVLPLA